MKVHLGKYHIQWSKRLFFTEFNGTNILFLGAELQGFKVDIIIIGILRRTSENWSLLASCL